MFITSLKDQKEFELVNKRGKKLHGKYFILVIAKNFSNILHTCQNTAFLGIKVSKKLDKRAVIRNKIKRRIKHLIRLIINNPKFKLTNLGMIIIPRKGFDKVDFSILTHELNKIFLQNI
ncbi:ribonuclease P protein component [Rickettsia endosymbiont of Halotydeus destructor]|uniref:ribonuclease P protein component n=1 Tax=Rickettsia endosymbiont of Halotydeus destructor TaxID=2996754 RepID=UPI003BB05809